MTNRPYFKTKGRIHCAILCVLLSTAAGYVSAEESAGMLRRAHAHNDYWHDRPLLDALDRGFASVEADVFLVDGKLLVGHGAEELRPERTLEALYLAPLRERVEQETAARTGENSPLTLLVDVKTDAANTYQVLNQVLAEYADILASVDEGEIHPGAIEVVISGNRPIDQITATSPRYASIDGRLPELDGNPPTHLMPLVSENWQSHFRWNGRGDMPNDEREKLRSIVRRVHDQGRKLRFWATPETAACWQELLAADVDLIGTDHLDALAAFLQEADRLSSDSAKGTGD